MSTAPAPLLDPEDLLRMPDGDHYELIDGVPKEKPMGAEADEIAAEVVALLKPFVKTNKLGRVYGSQTGYQCFPGRPKRVRMPDASFIAKGRLPGDKTPEGYIPITPDLAVEVLSPGEFAEELWEKLVDYRAAGIRLVWVLSPKTRVVQIRRADGTCAELDEAGTLSGEDVLPGFTCRVAELFV
ncbi:MAG TPA: Uma2 family endonuclease [Urbifossiella sp.]|nr:Uma2 family endonuclease [Urbifossiella sp.]